MQQAHYNQNNDIIRITVNAGYFSDVVFFERGIKDITRGDILEKLSVLNREDAAVFDDFIRGEGLIPRGSAAVIKGLNPSPTPQENNIPRGSAPGLLISYFIGYDKPREICYSFWFEKNTIKWIDMYYVSRWQENTQG